MSLTCFISEIPRDIGQKSPFEPTPLLFVAFVGVTPLEFRLSFWRHRTRLPGLLYGVVCASLHLAVLIQYRRVTDWRTDRRTDKRTDRRTHDDSIYRANI